MADEIDPRIVKIGIEIDGQIKYYEDLAIVATGTKFANENENECEVKITNLDKPTRDYLLTETSPFNQNKTPKRLIIDAGRKSYGTNRIYVGDITSAKVSQPPDITITLKATTGNDQKGNVVSKNQPGVANLSTIAQQVAQDLNLSLQFECKDKQLANYSFTGGCLKQVNKLGQSGGVSAFVDDTTLVMKDYGTPLEGRVKVLDMDTGMIGIPEITEKGIKVTYLIDNDTTLGGALDIRSVLNPSVNGTYNIYKLGFNIASRDTPFYYVAEASRI